MIVIPHSVHDNKNGKEIWFGIGDHGYTEATKWMADHKEGFFGANPQYEYFNNDMEIEFKWELTADDLRRFHSSDYVSDDYCGALFFGDYKVEFIWNEDYNYANCYVYGQDGYDVMSDGTPYDECDVFQADLLIPSRRTPRAFAEKVEEQIIELLNKHPDLIRWAVKPTDPDKWYPDGNYHTNINMIH